MKFKLGDPVVVYEIYENGGLFRVAKPGDTIDAIITELDPVKFEKIGSPKGKFYRGVFREIISSMKHTNCE